MSNNTHTHKAHAKKDNHAEQYGEIHQWFLKNLKNSWKNPIKDKITNTIGG